MRAVSEDKRRGDADGHRRNKVIIFTFVLGACMAGVGGVLYGFVYKQIYFYYGLLPGRQGVLGARCSAASATYRGRCSAGSFSAWSRHGARAVPRRHRRAGALSAARPIAYTMLVMVLIFRPRGPSRRKACREEGLSGAAGRRRRGPPRRTGAAIPVLPALRIAGRSSAFALPRAGRHSSASSPPAADRRRARYRPCHAARGRAGRRAPR